jgi:hypothetical protein
MGKRVGLLTAGSDSPGVNAAIRGLGKAATSTYNTGASSGCGENLIRVCCLISSLPTLAAR